MRKSPRGVCMTPKEYENFLQSLAELGIGYDPDKIPQTCMDEYAEILDKMDEVLENFKYYDKMYAGLLDVKNQFEEHTMYRGQKISFFNVRDYEEDIKGNMETNYEQLLDYYEQIMQLITL